MQDLAALSIGTLALLDVPVTRQAAAGLASALSNVQSALSAIAAGIATTFDGPRPAWEQPPAGSDAQSTVPVDWAVFSIMQRLLVNPSRQPGGYPTDMATVIARDEGQGIGRLGISAFRWMRVAEAETVRERSIATHWILERGAYEIEQAMRDSFHWRNLDAGLAPIEPELLLAGLILLSPGLSIETDTHSLDRPVVRATLAVAAGMLGNFELAQELGGSAADIKGELEDRWEQWKARVGDTALPW